MPKDPNERINKAIARKEKEAAEWRKDAKRAATLGDLGLAKILEGRARQADTKILDLKKKLK